MGIFNSSNPALNEGKIKQLSSSAVYSEQVMTLSGTINKTIFSLIILIAAGVYSYLAVVKNPALMTPFMIVGLVGTVISVIATIAKPSISKYSTLLYAIFEGLFLGVASIAIPAYFNDSSTVGSAPSVVVFQAVTATVFTFFVMLILYRTKILKVTNGFRTVVFGATAGIATVYLVFMVMSFFGQSNFLMGTSLLSIGVTAFAAVIAALNLAMDFDLIERLERNAAPKYMEWYGAFSILVTLVWLYLELLRLFSKLNNRN